MSLQEEITARASKIYRETYQMSIGELINLYRDGEMDIHPEFQRVFRWSEYQKTKLIESITSAQNRGSVRKIRSRQTAGTASETVSAGSSSASTSGCSSSVADWLSHCFWMMRYCMVCCPAVWSAGSVKCCMVYLGVFAAILAVFI